MKGHRELICMGTKKSAEKIPEPETRAKRDSNENAKIERHLSEDQHQAQAR